MPLKTNGAALRELRERKGMTITEFARRAGYSMNHVSQIELGHLPGGVKFRRAAARVLRCRIGSITVEAPAPAEQAMEQVS